MAVVELPGTNEEPDTGKSSRVAPVEAVQHLAAIVDSSDDAIISKNLQGIITSWNAAASRVFGYQPEEIVGRSILTLIPPELHSEEPEIIRKVSSGERIEHFETKRLRKDGERIHISLTISPIRNSEGTIIGISKIARDITGRKRAEAALFESERMAAIGRMAASIAHEVNNPLEAILNLSYLLCQNDSLDEAAQGYARLLHEEVVRVSEITRQTLSFYRDNTSAAEVDVPALLDGLIAFHRPLFSRKAIQVFTKYRPHTSLFARPGELRQIFTNLLINSVDALPYGGHIRISVRQLRNPSRVCISLADNGSGIPEPNREKVFEPFFSTKLGKGTGLGLWVTLGIVRKYGGTLRMRTNTDQGRQHGTVFRVCLPCSG